MRIINNAAKVPIARSADEHHPWHPYDAYRTPGSPHLGPVPQHWSIMRLRYASIINPKKSEIDTLVPETDVSFVPMERIGADGTLSLNETRRLQEVWEDYTYFREDDTVVAKITPCFENGKGAHCKGLSNGVGFGTTELHVIRPRPFMHSRFLFYLTRTSMFRDGGIASMYGAAGQQRVPDEFFKNYVVAVPPFNEQRAIVAFLDRETARIDALIAKKERLVELLYERLAVLICDVVTKGIDGDASMTASDIDWLDRIPTTWSIQPLKRLARDISRGRRPEYVQHSSLRVINQACIYWEGLRLENVKYQSDQSVVREKAVVQRGDLLVNSTGTGTLGRANVLNEDGTFLIDSHITRIRFRRNAVPEFFCYLLRTPLYQGYIYSAVVSGATNQIELSRERLAASPMLVPPENEQHAIVAFLDREVETSDALVTKQKDAIDLLKTYRTALISAAVTGKIDVRDEVIS